MFRTFLFGVLACSMLAEAAAAQTQFYNGRLRNDRLYGPAWRNLGTYGSPTDDWWNGQGASPRRPGLAGTQMRQPGYPTLPTMPSNSAPTMPYQPARQQPPVVRR